MKNIIVNMTGQLGNQMFQYAVYRKIQLSGKKVKIDRSYYDVYPYHHGLHIFNLPINIATRKESLIEKDEFRSYPDRIRRKFLGKRKNVISEIDSNAYIYNERVFLLKRGYIDGYWQSEKYFLDIRDVLIQDFTFPAIEDAQNKDLINQIVSNNAVSLHIRRGDYAGGFPMMDKAYYDKAIAYFEAKGQDVVFYVFSNDMEWARENIKAKELVFVDCNTGMDSWKDMHLMTVCKHNIIANSSFSWWGAWLNQNPNKEVIAPKAWFNHVETPDVYCENWKVI